MKERLTLSASLVALATGISALCYAIVAAPSTASSAGTIEVNATGQLNTTPDTLTMQFSVSTNAHTAAAALNRNNTEMSHLQSILRKNGIASRAQQTSGLSVGPTYNNAGKINGYQAQDDLSATSHDIARSGTTIDAIENSVGNDVQVDSINFSLSNDSSLLHRARVLAMQQAHLKAKDFAQGANEQLGPVVRISPVQENVPQPFAPLSAAAGTARAPVPIRPGTQQVSVQVDVVYRIVS